jgi:hypothetical protein
MKIRNRRKFTQYVYYMAQETQTAKTMFCADATDLFRYQQTLTIRNMITFVFTFQLKYVYTVTVVAFNSYNHFQIYRVKKIT